jgi:acyl-CoA synthetase (AMP-forming)/AMP-acid ligase II
VNVTEMLEWSADRFADRTACLMGEQAVSYREVDERATRVAHSLLDLGVRKADRVAVVVGNRPEYVEAESAVAKAGAVRTPILIRSSTKDVAYMLEASEATAVIVSAEGLEAVREAIAEKGLDLATIVIGTEPGEGEHAYEDLVAAGSPRRLELDLTGEDLYALRFTGGTTGRPKGVLMDHRMMSTVISNMLINWPIEEDDVVVHFHPLSHAAGMIMYPWLMRGSKQVIMPAFNFRPEALLETIQQEHGTAMFMIPRVLNVVLDAGILDGYDTSSVRTIVYGGAPPPLQRIKQGLATFGPVFVQLYGTSEAPNILTTLLRDEHVFEGEPPRRLGSAGRVGFGVEVKVVDDDGVECKPGQVGEIVSRGDHIMVGYWKDPELTAERLVDGWLHTRDMGSFDEDGYLYITDRKDDMIISGGFNVWPAEVEDVLYEHEDVTEVAVFGVDDEKWGESIVAAVIVRDDGTTADDLKEFAREKMARHKVPKDIWVRAEAIPKSPAGKPLRRETREQYLRSLVPNGGAGE